MFLKTHEARLNDFARPIAILKQATQRARVGDLWKTEAIRNLEGIETKK